MNRLDFFKTIGKGAMAVAAIPLLPMLPKSAPKGPVYYGTGIHDSIKIVEKVITDGRFIILNADEIVMDYASLESTIKQLNGRSVGKE